MSLEQHYPINSLADYDDTGFNSRRNVGSHTNNSTGNNTIVPDRVLAGLQTQALTGFIATAIGDEAVVSMGAGLTDVTTGAFGDDGAGGLVAENHQIHGVLMDAFRAVV